MKKVDKLLEIRRLMKKRFDEDIEEYDVPEKLYHLILNRTYSNLERWIEKTNPIPDINVWFEYNISVIKLITQNHGIGGHQKKEIEQPMTSQTAEPIAHEAIPEFDFDAFMRIAKAKKLDQYGILKLLKDIRNSSKWITDDSEFADYLSKLIDNLENYCKKNYKEEKYRHFYCS